MKQGDFIEKLLDALEDERVRKKLAEIGSRETKAELSKNGERFEYGEQVVSEDWKENAKLREKLAEMEAELAKAEERQDEYNEMILGFKREKAQWKKRLEEKEAELGKAEEQCRLLSGEVLRLREEKKELEDVCQKKAKRYEQRALEAEQISERYSRGYGELEQQFQRYLRLDDDVHEELKRVLSAESPEMFLASGTQWKNLEAMWDVMSYRIMDYDEKTLDSLREVFDYFFAVYGKLYQKKYERLEVFPGDEFDEQIHMRSADSAVSGKISRVLLQGYRGVVNGKVKKSIVKI